MCIVGDSKLGEGLYKWIHDCQEDLYFSTSLFKRGLGTCHLSFGLEVESEPMDDSLWEEDIQSILDVHSKDQVLESGYSSQHEPGNI